MANIIMHLKQSLINVVSNAQLFLLHSVYALCIYFSFMRNIIFH